MSVYAALLINAIPGIKGLRYLELGIDNEKATFATFSKVLAQEKYGVDRDANPGVTHQMTTDEFFEFHADALAPFDVVFIDADHHHEPVITDYNHAIDFLAPGGLILAHDLVPPDEAFCKRDSCSTGFYLLNALMNRGDEHWTLNDDMGLTVFPYPQPIRPENVAEVEWGVFKKAIDVKRMGLEAILEKVRAR